MNKRAQKEVYWVLVVIILILLGFLIWAVFTGKVGSFLANWELP